MTLLILVKTKVSSVKRRNIIRETYGEGVVKYNVSAKIVFLTGISGEYNSTLQAQLHSEADIHGDILQEGFIDSYYNLTIKLIMAAKWASTFCNNSYYVMSTDDDVIVDIVNLVNDLEANTFRSKFVLAEPAIGWKPQRDTQSKWYTPYQFYSEKSWPPFPRGYAYIVSRDVAHDIYRASQKMAAPIPWDDVYCGMLLQTLGVGMRNIIPWFQSRHGHEKQVSPLKARDHYVIMYAIKKPPMKTWRAVEHRYKKHSQPAVCPSRKILRRRSCTMDLQCVISLIFFRIHLFRVLKRFGDVVLQIGQSFIYTSEYMSVMNGSHSQDTFKSNVGFNNVILCRLIYFY